MGIPSYFAFLLKEYPEIIKEKLDNDIGRIFLDLNCAIHPCCRNIIKKYESQKIDIIELENKMIESILEYINDIVKFTNPKELLYISIDGVPPRAKCTQQRLRRFKSIKEKKFINELKLESGLDTEDLWDTNAITPGTIFMKKLSEAIKKNMSKYKNINCNIILSDANVPGEGEHKILQYLKNNQKTNDNYNDIIYGLDADLIMLAMSTNNSNIALLREPVHFKNKNFDPDEDNLPDFLYLDINYLKSQLVYEICLKLDKDNISFEQITDHLIKDYIFMCMLLGNDFLPHLPSLSIKTGGINKLIDIYTTIKNTEKGYLINETNINLKFLLKLLYKIKETEDTDLLENYKFRKKFKIPDSNAENFYQEKMHELNYYPLLNNKIDDIVLFGHTGWRDRYYKNCFNNIQGRLFEINKICKNYYEGLIWNAEYYFNKCASWTWYYKYRHSPSVSDLISYIENKNTNSKPIFDISTPFEPFLLLMIVLPPESNHLLPESYKNIYKDILSGISEYYPIDYELDVLNKKYYWECTPILPDVNITKINKIINNFKITASEKERNLVSKEYVIKKLK